MKIQIISITQSGKWHRIQLGGNPTHANTEAPHLGHGIPVHRKALLLQAVDQICPHGVVGVILLLREHVHNGALPSPQGEGTAGWKENNVATNANTNTYTHTHT